MIDSTNPRIMAGNIKALSARSEGTSVVANPEGSPTAELNKIGIGETVYSVGGSSALDYKLTEQDTGSKWVNNKPVYQKTYELTAISSSWAALETNADVEDIISSSPVVVSDSTDNLAYYTQARVVRSTGSVEYKASTSVSLLSETKAYLTLRYTKKASSSKSRKK